MTPVDPLQITQLVTDVFDAMNNGYELRWFTPSTEVDLCGHATLASAHILWEKSYLARSKVAYSMKSFSCLLLLGCRSFVRALASI